MKRHEDRIALLKEGLEKAFNSPIRRANSSIRKEISRILTSNIRIQRGKSCIISLWDFNSRVPRADSPIRRVKSPK